MQVKLRVLEGSNAGKEIRIPGPTFRIGRGEKCQLRPKSDSVSRNHCEIRIDEDSIVIIDLGSRNGTFVNDDRLEPNTKLQLQMGNQIRVGRLAFELVVSHGLDAGKRGKVADVKEAAARAATPAQGESSVEDDDISDWLADDASDTQARTLGDPETRQFKFDRTDKIALENATLEEEASEEEASEEEAIDGEPDDEDTGGSGWFRRKSKQKPKQKPKKLGKLPDKSKPQSDSSGEAAADMLRKFFNRG